MPTVEVRVKSVAHLDSLIDRGFRQFKLSTKSSFWGTSSEFRTLTTNLYVYKSNRSSNFAYDACIKVLQNEESRYDAALTCLGEWSAHELAEETAEWI